MTTFLRQSRTYRVGQPLMPTTPSLLLARSRDVPRNSPVSHLAKVLLPDASPKRKAQFEHERRLMLNFSHCAIPTVAEDGEHDGVEYFILEYVLGVDLGRLLGHPKFARVLSGEIAVYILCHLADALRYVHEFEFPNSAKDDFLSLPVIHRDVCPAHVLLSIDGDVLLTGFSSANSRLLRSEYAALEPSAHHYRAPEFGDGRKATTVSDLYSLAVIFWEMLSGKHYNPTDFPNPFTRRLQGPRMSDRVLEVLRVDFHEDPERRHESAYRVIQRLSQSPEAAEAARARQELAALVCAVFDARRYG